jgi:hypothetical protein
MPNDHKPFDDRQAEELLPRQKSIQPSQYFILSQSVSITLNDLLLKAHANVISAKQPLASAN